MNHQSSSASLDVFLAEECEVCPGEPILSSPEQIFKVNSPRLARRIVAQKIEHFLLQIIEFEGIESERTVIINKDFGDIWPLVQAFRERTMNQVFGLPAADNGQTLLTYNYDVQEGVLNVLGCVDVAPCSEKSIKKIGSYMGYSGEDTTVLLQERGVSVDAKATVITQSLTLLRDYDTPREGLSAFAEAISIGCSDYLFQKYNTMICPCRMATVRFLRRFIKEFNKDNDRAFNLVGDILPYAEPNHPLKYQENYKQHLSSSGLPENEINALIKGFFSGNKLDLLIMAIRGVPRDDYENIPEIK